ncbi:MAG: hypothetical protein J3K34DRAFT_509318 [Monoraphidium minutum]|nr:MAG: hypothetical protein J3K34DRAFT_509318 [Monoraphidium minutum]
MEPIADAPAAACSAGAAKQPFEEELGTICDLQARALAAPPGELLLGALGDLEAALAALQRPARYFSDFHPDPGHAAAAAALLEVCRLAAGEVYGHPHLLAALLATAARLLPEGARREEAEAAIDAAAAAAAAGTGAGRGAPRASPAVAALAAAAAALDGALFDAPPGDEGAAAAGAPPGSWAPVGGSGDAHLLLACRHALRSAAAALSRQVCDEGGGGAAGAGPHPYAGDSRGAAAGPEPGASGVGSASASSGGGSAAAAAVEAAAVAFGRVASDPRLSPLLVMTEAQADVIAPVLRDAGLDAAAWAPLRLRPAARGAHEQGQQQAERAPPLRLRCSRRLRVAPGPGGLLELTGLVGATEAAAEWLARHGSGDGNSSDGGRDGGEQEQGRREAAGDGGGAAVPQRGWLQVAAGAPLRVLVVTRDVLSLLLQQHPNADVRRLLHARGLAPRRRLMLAALSALAGARGALAAERGSAGYLQLLLGEGSPLRDPAAVEGLLSELAAGVSRYAADDVAALRRLAGRRARATGRGGGGGGGEDGGGEDVGGGLAPWDVDYYMQQAAVGVADGAVWVEFADYFTLPALWAGLDRLLAAALGLRLLPPRGCGGGGGEGGQAWAPGVWHLQLWDARPPADLAGRGGPGSSGGGGASSVGSASGGGEAPGDAWLLLGDVFIEVAPPGGFPFTSLLRPAARRPGAGGAAGGRGGGLVPGAVVIRLPLALSGEGHPPGADGPPPPGRPPALRGPFGLRALLHEAGHATALLAAGAAAPHALLAAAGGAGGGAGSVELRELPSHALEGWAADARALRLLSGHWRGGRPLPPKAAGRLARYAFSAGACGAADLHEALLLALADAALHAAPGGGGGGGGGDACGGESAGADAGGGSGGGGSAAECVFDAVWAAHGVLPGGGHSLEALRGLEACGPVGGAKWGYAVARLLAAGARKRWLGRDALCPEGGQQLKERLLYGLGRGAAPHALLAALLGRGALARVEVPAGGEGGGGGGEGGGGAGSGGDVRPARPRVCWPPDPFDAAFQGVDLLG